MRNGLLNNWMGWAASTVEAEAFKALAIVKENPPSTLCSMAVIYARASKRVPYGSQHWMHKAMSGLAKHTLETAAKRASHSCGWSNDSGSAIIQLCILNTWTNDKEGRVEYALCVPRKNMEKQNAKADNDQSANYASHKVHRTCHTAVTAVIEDPKRGKQDMIFMLCTL